MQKILILGKNGMLGHMVYQYLIENPIDGYETIGTTREDFDFINLYSFEKLKKFVLGSDVKIIINCVGVLIDESNNNPDVAILINSYLPHFLSRLCIENDIKFYHISTDCVFDGNGIFNKNARYDFIDYPDSKTIYGRTKSLGDELDINISISNSSLRFHNSVSVIRTSIVGPNINRRFSGLFDWFFNEQNPCGYTNHFWTGTTTLEIAKFISHLIQEKIFCMWTNFGSLSWGCQEVQSKFEVISLINDVFGLKKTIIPRNTEEGQNKALIYTWKCDDFNGLTFEKALYKLKNWMISHPNLYKESYSKIFEE